MLRPVGVSAQSHVGDGHVGITGNGGDVAWLRRDVANEIRLIGGTLMFFLTLTICLARGIATCHQVFGQNGIFCKNALLYL